MKQSIQVTRIDHCYCFFFCSHSFIYQITSDLQSSLSCSLTVTCLQHVQFTMFYSKLHILHISVVSFQSFANFFELFECFRELLFHLGNMHRCTNTGNYVFTLCICQEFAEQTVVTCCRVTCECYTGTTVITHVTECHHLYVNCCSPGIRNIVITTIYVSTWVIPRTEYSFDSAHQLFLRICREFSSDFFFVFSFELISQLFQIFCCQFNVLFYASVSFHFVDQLFEVFFSYFHNYVRVHLDKSSVAIPCPTRISGMSCQNFYYFFIQTQVQDSIHHTRHGCSCTRTNGNQKRIFFVAEFLSGDLFHFCDGFHDLSHDLIINFSSVFIVLSTSFCCNCEALWYRQS